MNTLWINIAFLPSSQEWLQEHRVIVAWLGLLSIVTLVLCIILLPVIVVRMREDHFLTDQPATDENYKKNHPAISWTILALKNLLGLILVIAGIAMLALPGQGLLTIFLGLFVMNFPGKRSLEVLFLRIPGILPRLNKIRTKAKRPPLKLPPR